MRRTLIWDRGNEMARHGNFTTPTGNPASFCDAYSPWQRGTNENTNGLLRQCLPKSTDLNLTVTTRLEEIVAELNNRPRKALGWQAPHEVFNAATAALTALKLSALLALFWVSVDSPDRGDVGAVF